MLILPFFQRIDFYDLVLVFLLVKLLCCLGIVKQILESDRILDNTTFSILLYRWVACKQGHA